MPLSNGITAMNKKWQELGERFPEGDKYCKLILGGMLELASGVPIEDCIKNLRQKKDDQRLLVLFQHLAVAYQDANL